MAIRNTLVLAVTAASIALSTAAFASDDEPAPAKVEAAAPAADAAKEAAPAADAKAAAPAKKHAKKHAKKAAPAEEAK